MFMISDAMNSIVAPRKTSRDVRRTVVAGGAATVVSGNVEARIGAMAGLFEAIEIKRKTYFEYENAPYHCLDVEVSKPTARGGQTLVRLKMRNLLTRAVFDKTFKAGEKFREPDLEVIPATYLYGDGSGFHFLDQQSFETLTIGPDTLGDDRLFLVDNLP